MFLFLVFLVVLFLFLFFVFEKGDREGDRAETEWGALADRAETNRTTPLLFSAKRIASGPPHDKERRSFISSSLFSFSTDCTERTNQLRRCASSSRRPLNHRFALDFRCVLDMKVPPATGRRRKVVREPLQRPLCNGKLWRPTHSDAHLARTSLGLPRSVLVRIRRLRSITFASTDIYFLFLRVTAASPVARRGRQRS